MGDIAPFLCVINCLGTAEADEAHSELWGYERVKAVLDLIVPPLHWHTVELPIHNSLDSRIRPSDLSFLRFLGDHSRTGFSEGLSLIILVDHETAPVIVRWLNSEPRQFFLKLCSRRLKEFTASLIADPNRNGVEWLAYVIALSSVFNAVGKAVIIAPPPLAPDHTSTNPPAHPHDGEVAREYYTNSNRPSYWVETLQTNDMVENFLLTFVGNVLFSFAPTPGDIEEHRFVVDGRLSEAKQRRSGFEQFSRSPQFEFYHDWFRQEFGGRRITRDFLAFIVTSLRLLNYRPHQLLQKTVQYSIGALRVSRMMARWNLEGDPFRFSIMLTVYDEYERDRDLNALILFTPENPIPFNFLCLDQIRDIAEAAQTLDAALLVTADDGLLRAVCRLPPDESSCRLTRRIFGPHRAADKVTGITICCPPSGLLEVYGSRCPPSGTNFLEPDEIDKTIQLASRVELAFWYDGFSWQRQPFHSLERLLFRHLNGEPGSVKPILGAISELMDSHGSSIIVLIDEADKAVLDRFAGRELRPGIILNDDRVALHEANTATIAALLRLDGAHVIDRDGYILHISRLIRGADRRYVVNGLTESEAELFRDAISNKYRMHKRYMIQQDVATKSNTLVIHDFHSTKDALELTQLLQLTAKSERMKSAASLALKIRSVVTNGMRFGVFHKTEGDKAAGCWLSGKHREEKKQRTAKWILLPEPPVNESSGDDGCWGYLVLFSLTLSKSQLESFTEGLKKLRGVYFAYVNDELNKKREYGRRRWTVFVHEDSFLEFVWQDFGAEHDVPIPLKSALRRYYEFGVSGVEGHSTGSGRRAAATLVDYLPRSAVIKVSSSGTIRIFEGNQYGLTTKN